MHAPFQTIQFQVLATTMATAGATTCLTTTVAPEWKLPLVNVLSIPHITGTTATMAIMIVRGSSAHKVYMYIHAPVYFNACTG